MTSWWYLENDESIGPLDVHEIEQLLQQRRISSTTMLKREGTETWRALREIPELEALTGAAQASAPAPPASHPEGFSLATNWQRFFARLFDIYWETMLLGAAVGMTLGRYSATFLHLLDQRISTYVFQMALLALAMPLDAAIYRFFGNTPGKALLKLKVTGRTDSKLSFGAYLQRNIEMWAMGLGLGIPLLNLFTMAYQSRRLAAERGASYDAPNGYQVLSQPTTLGRKSVTAVCFLLVIGGGMAFRTMDRWEQRAALDASDYMWENPITKRSSKIKAMWKHVAVKNSTGDDVHQFVQRGNRALVVFFGEVTETDFATYTSRFLRGNEKKVRFADAGRFYRRDGRSSWEVEGTMIDDADTRWRVEIVQVGNVIWRSVAVQIRPYGYSDAPVAQLKDALWSTIH